MQGNKNKKRDGREDGESGESMKGLFRGDI